MMIGISTHVFAMWPLQPRYLELIRKAGFRAVELWGMAPHVEIDKEGALAKAGQWIRDAGLKTASVHLPFYRRWGAPDFRFLCLGDPDRDDAKLAGRLTRIVLDQCPDVGADIAVLHGVNAGRCDNDTLRGFYEQDLAPILERAEKLDVTLAVENIMTDLSKSHEIAALLDRIDSPHLKACLDFGHANVNENVPDAINNLGKRIVNTHLHDNRGDSDDHMIPGEGNIDWTMAAKKLKGYGDPNLIVELFGPAAGSRVDEEVFPKHLSAAYKAAEKIFGA